MLLKLLEGGLDYPESKLGGLGICLLLAPPANNVLLYLKHFSIILETVYDFFSIVGKVFKEGLKTINYLRV